MLLEHCCLGFDQTELAPHTVYLGIQRDHTLPTVGDRDTCLATNKKEIGYDTPE